MKKRIFLCLTLAVVVLCGFTVSATSDGSVSGSSSNVTPTTTTTQTVSSDGDKYLTFETNGGMMMGGVPTVYSNSYPDKWPIPVKSGYVFGGWYLEPVFVSPVVDAMLGTSLNGDITLYAKWIASDEQSTSAVLGWFGNMSSSLFGWLQSVVDFIVSYPLIWIGILLFFVCGGCIALFNRFRN